MPRLKTHEEFLKDLWEKNDSYRNGDFVVVGKYKNKSSKILLKNRYGYAVAIANNLLKNYTLTIRSALHPNEYLKEMFREVHGYRYNYDQINYVNAHKKLKIICSNHGAFYKNSNKHLLGEGCPKCKSEHILHINRIRPTGWSHTNWLKASRVSKNFDSFKMYILRLYNEEEDFIKVGRTYSEIARRAKHFPYKYEVIYTVKGYSKDIISLENFYKKQLSEKRYSPRKDFEGQYECFTKESLTIIKEINLKVKYNNLLNKGYLQKFHPTLSLSWEEDKKEWMLLHSNYKVEDDW